jgi:hypothetical protein
MTTRLSRPALTPLRSLALALAAAAALGGCTLSVDRADVEVPGWDVNGVPANAANCSDFGVDVVRWEFVDTFDGFVEEIADFDCRDGVFSFTIFDALRPGTYQTVITAFDFDGRVVDEFEFGRRFTVVTNQDFITFDAAGIPNILTTAVGADLELPGWDINGVPADATSCGPDLFDISEVTIEAVDLADDFVVVSQTFACREGSQAFVFEGALPPGDYRIDVIAFDGPDPNVVVDEFELTQVTVRASDGRVAVELPNIQRPRFEITWDAAGFTCAQAGVDEVALELVPAGGGGGDPVFLPCSDDGYLFNLFALGFGNGNFDLLIDGFADPDDFADFGQRCTGVRIPTEDGTFFCDNVPKI